MTEAAQKRYAEKDARMRAAIALKEGDRVPVQVSGGIYAVARCGYTMAEIVYDETMEKMKEVIRYFQETYDPDTAMGADQLAGQGRGLEMIAPTFIDWPGRPGNKLDANSLMQFIEFPVLEDDDFEFFFSDRTGWEMKKSMPLLAGFAEPLKELRIPLSHRGHMIDLIRSFSRPELRDFVEKCTWLNEFFAENAKKQAEVRRWAVEQGFPTYGGGKAMVAFDEYSDTLRGTLASLMDLYERPEDVQHFIDEYHPKMIAAIKAMNPDGSKNGKFVNMTLHKGLDGFMSDEYYVKYYWRYLQEIIQTIVDVGMVPYVFCEGKYLTRVHHLADIPKGKVIYKFEDTPMELAKKTVGDVACITGGFDNTLLSYGSVQQVEDACKQMIDVCAPGGGFIFTTKSGLIDTCKQENVDAMFRTLREYGKY